MTTRRQEVAPLFCSRVRLLVCVRLRVGVGERTFPPPDIPLGYFVFLPPILDTRTSTCTRQLLISTPYETIP